MLREVVDSIYWSYYEPRPFQLPQDGEYTLEVSVEYLTSEGFAFGMHQLDSMQPLVIGEVQEGDPFIYRVSAEAGQILLLDMLPRFSGDSYGDASGWSLFTIDETEIAASQSQDADGWIVIPETGEYFLRHMSQFQFGQRSVAFRLLDVADAPALALDTVTVADFAFGGQTEIFKVEGDANGVLQFAAMNDSSVSALMTLIKANGQIISGTASNQVPFYASVAQPGTEYLLGAHPSPWMFPACHFASRRFPRRALSQSIRGRRLRWMQTTPGVA